MADYCACTELEPLLDEIRTCFQEANERHESVSLTLSNTGKTYPYVLQRHHQPNGQQVNEVAGKALEILRGGLTTAACTN